MASTSSSVESDSVSLTLLPGLLTPLPGLFALLPGPPSLPTVCCLFCDAQTNLHYLENERLSIIHLHHPGNVDLGAMEHSIRSLYPQCTEWENTLEKVCQYPNKKLFCNACREEIGLKSSVVSNHIKSSKHKVGKERMAKKEAAECDIATSFQNSSQELHSRGETLPEEQCI